MLISVQLGMNGFGATQERSFLNLCFQQNLHHGTGVWCASASGEPEGGAE